MANTLPKEIIAKLDAKEGVVRKESGRIADYLYAVLDGMRVEDDV